MNTSKVIILSVISMLLQSTAIQSARAQDVFRASFNVTCVSTNENGALVYQHMDNRDLISACAADEGLTNLAGLRLVYNLTDNALEVVTRTNNTSVGTNFSLIGTNLYLICTPFTFMDIVSLTGTNTNKVELLASVFVETNSVASGTLAATERFRYNSSNVLSSFSLVGTIQYAVPANGTNSAMICVGTLVASSGDFNHHDGDNDDDDHGTCHNGGNGGHDNNGNHGHGRGNDHHGR
jgi:hypothetical protein